MATARKKTYCFASLAAISGLRWFSGNREGPAVIQSFRKVAPHIRRNVTTFREHGHQTTSKQDAPCAGVDGARDAKVEHFEWTFEGRPLGVEYEVHGTRSPDATGFVFMPAFSTISTRAECQPLISALRKELAGRQPGTPTYALAVDWPGFGGSDRPPLAYSPTLFSAFARAFFSRALQDSPPPRHVVAAGHSAAFALEHSGGWAESCVLIGPTWRGPLPTVLAKFHVPDAVARGTLATLRAALLSGPGSTVSDRLYTWITTAENIERQCKRHVYARKQFVTPALVTAKTSGTQAPGAKYGSIAYVTGSIDAVRDGTELADVAAACISRKTRVLQLIGESTPAMSRAEMDLLRHVAGVQTEVIPGALLLHEEFPIEAAKAIVNFVT